MVVVMCNNTSKTNNLVDRNYLDIPIYIILLLISL